MINYLGPNSHLIPNCDKAVQNNFTLKNSIYPKKRIVKLDFYKDDLKLNNLPFSKCVIKTMDIKKKLFDMFNVQPKAKIYDTLGDKRIRSFINVGLQNVLKTPSMLSFVTSTKLQLLLKAGHTIMIKYRKTGKYNKSQKLIAVKAQKKVAGFSKHNKLKTLLKLAKKHNVNIFSTQFKDAAKLLYHIRKSHKLATSINDKRCVKTFQTHLSAKKAYIVMEYPSNMTLDHLLDSLAKQKKRLPLDLIQKISRDIFLALEYLHKNNIAHADVKPLNIVFTKKYCMMLEKYLNNQAPIPDKLPSGPSIKLIDFEHSQKLDKLHKYSMSNCCTPLYTCPEELALHISGITAKLFSKKMLLKKSDTWTGGVITYEMLFLDERTAFLKKANSILSIYGARIKQRKEISRKKAYNIEYDFCKKILVDLTIHLISPEKALKHPLLASQKEVKLPKCHQF